MVLPKNWISNIAAYLLLVAFFATKALAADTKLEKVNLKLKWYHQYQFAGFYAAKKHGFFAEEGLDVEIIESNEKSPAIDFVRSRKNSYGVSSAELIDRKAKGDPLILVAAIFQHSPYVIISLKSNNINSPKDLIGKKLMASEDQGMLQLNSMLKANNVNMKSINIIEHTWNNLDITNGYADAMTGYISVEPYQLRKLGYETTIIKPIDFGVDFYGDILFTDIDEVELHPERVAAMKRASIKGWDYAMSHIDEMADYILQLPGVKERGITKENLVYEALMMQKLVKSDLVEIGHINKTRINNMIKLYKDYNVIKSNSDFSNFIFEEDKDENTELNNYTNYFWLLILIGSVFILAVYFWNRQLRKKVDQHVSELEDENKNRVLAEKIAKESQERLELALSAARLGIWDSDLTSGIVYRNSIWSEMLGYQPFEIESTYDGWRKLVHPEDYERIDKSIESHHSGNSLYNNYEHRLLTKSGEWKWILSLSKIVSVDAKGMATRLIGIHIDIDEIKSKEIQLQALSDELIHSNRELEKFAYITSHNLRAPVVNIISLLELLDLDSITDANNKIIIDKVQLSVNRLESTLHDLIEVVTAKKQALTQKTIIKLSNVCKEVISNLESQLVKVDAEIVMNFEAVDEILSVKAIMESVFQNLITNSIKYRNPDKKLKIEISSHKEQEYIYIYVRDNGIGFDSQLLGHKIFKLYERLHHHIEGKGLGLYLIKTQIESLNGKIEVNSKPMQGALFTITFKSK